MDPLKVPTDAGRSPRATLSAVTCFNIAVATGVADVVHTSQVSFSRHWRYPPGPEVHKEWFRSNMQTWCTHVWFVGHFWPSFPSLWPWWHKKPDGYWPSRIFHDTVGEMALSCHGPRTSYLMASPPEPGTVAVKYRIPQTTPSHHSQLSLRSLRSPQALAARFLCQWRCRLWCANLYTLLTSGSSVHLIDCTRNHAESRAVSILGCSVATCKPLHHPWCWVKINETISRNDENLFLCFLLHFIFPWWSTRDYKVPRYLRWDYTIEISIRCSRGSFRIGIWIGCHPELAQDLIVGIIRLVDLSSLQDQSVKSMGLSNHMIGWSVQVDNIIPSGAWSIETRLVNEANKADDLGTASDWYSRRREHHRLTVSSRNGFNAIGDEGVVEICSTMTNHFLIRLHSRHEMDCWCYAV